MNNIDLLLNAVDSLNAKLAVRDIFIELTIVGSVSIYLNGLRVDHPTKDIDYIEYEPSDEFLNCVHEVANEAGLPKDWINNRADSIEPLPTEIKSEVFEDTRFSNIKMRVIKPSLITKFKIYAYYMRREDKDLVDLKNLVPSKSLIDDGIDFIKSTIIHHHGGEHLKREEEDLESFKRYLYEHFL